LSDIGISVIIRTKDRPDLLRQALESVAQQAFEPLEAVVVNDGGADVSAVLEGFSGRLDIRHQRLDPPLGRSPAANRGLALASHPWITFLDDDDLLEPGALAALAEHTGEPAVIYGRVTAWQMVPDDGEPRAFTEFGRPFDRAALLFENFIPMIGTLMPRDAVLAAGGIDEALDCYEDWDLYLRLSETLPCRFVDRDVAAYRVFGEAFITGAGGQEKQHRGRETIYRKHWSALDPETLSRMQYHAKGHLIPEAVARESEAWKDRLADLEHGLDDARKGAAFYQEQVEERDGRLKTVWQEREAIAAERDDALRQRHALGQRCDGLTRELQSETSRTTPVSVVIVNYNGRHHLEECLPSVAQTANVPIEVIVADNGSTDDSLEWVREHHPDVRILELGANLGFGEANRRGIEASTSEYVALLNNDTVVERGWLHEMLRVLMADPTVGAACSTLHFMQHPGVLTGAAAACPSWATASTTMRPARRRPVRRFQLSATSSSPLPQPCSCASATSASAAASTRATSCTTRTSIWAGACGFWAGGWWWCGIPSSTITSAAPPAKSSPWPGASVWAAATTSAPSSNTTSGSTLRGPSRGS
jgi:GT2 family glycosyltransferase